MLEIFISFGVAVVADVVADIICKWLDSRNDD